MSDKPDIAELERMMTDAACRPWRVDLDNRPGGAHQVLDADGRTVCFISNGWPLGVDTANTEIIVAAVNALPSLPAAARRVEELEILNSRLDARYRSAVDTVQAMAIDSQQQTERLKGLLFATESHEAQLHAETVRLEQECRAQADEIDRLRTDNTELRRYADLHATNCTAATKARDQEIDRLTKRVKELGVGSLQDFWYDNARWSQATFGTDTERGPMGPIKHLAKEVQEVLADPNDLEEYADCIFLVFDACRRAGFAYGDLTKMLWRKLEINKARTWNKPTSDEPVEHIRDTQSQAEGKS